MKNSKLYRLLETLAPRELNEFARYLQSEFFNRKQVLSKFAALLIAAIKARQPEPEKEQLYRKLFKEELAKFDKMGPKASEKHLRKRMDTITYELKNHLEDYLVWKQGQEKGFARDNLLLQAYEAHRADAFFFEQYEKISRELDREDPRPIINYYQSYRLNQIAHEHPGYQRWTNTRADVGGMQEQLDIYFMTSKLMNSWVLLLGNLVINRQSEILMLDEMLSLTQRPPFKGNLLIDIYSRAIQDLREGSFSLEGLRYLKGLILPELTRRKPMEQIGLFNLLLNYTVLTGQFSGEEAPEEHFELLKFALKQEYVLRNGGIGYSDFYNMVNAALRVGEVAWAEKFVVDYGPLLPEEIRLPTVTLQRARIRHEAGDQRQALAILNARQAFTSPLDKVLVRVLTIQCYYELEEDDLLESMLESTRKHLARNTGLGEAFRVQIRNFLRFTFQLDLARQSADPVAALAPIRTELAGGKISAAQYWLEQQVEALSGGR